MNYIKFLTTYLFLSALALCCGSTFAQSDPDTAAEWINHHSAPITVLGASYTHSNDTPIHTGDILILKDGDGRVGSFTSGSTCYLLSHSVVPGYVLVEAKERPAKWILQKDGTVLFL
jgi:hypothetical protein